MAQKLTKSAVEKVKRTTDNTLLKYVCNYVLERWSDYKNKKAIFTDVLNYGCQSGIVGALCYYSDTLAFYERFKTEINLKLYECLEGVSNNFDPAELFGAKWDKTDPLALDTQNQNLLAWFGFEETLRDLGLMFDDLQDYL